MIYNRDAIELRLYFFFWFSIKPQLIVASSSRMPIIPAFSGIHKKNTKNIFEISLLIWINLLYLWRQKVNVHVKVLLF